MEGLVDAWYAERWSDVSLAAACTDGPTAARRAHRVLLSCAIGWAREHLRYNPDTTDLVLPAADPPRYRAPRAVAELLLDALPHAVAADPRPALTSTPAPIPTPGTILTPCTIPTPDTRGGEMARLLRARFPDAGERLRAAACAAELADAWAVPAAARALAACLAAEPGDTVGARAWLLSRLMWLEDRKPYAAVLRQLRRCMACALARGARAALSDLSFRALQDVLRCRRLPSAAAAAVVAAWIDDDRDGRTPHSTHLLGTVARRGGGFVAVGTPRSVGEPVTSDAAWPCGMRARITVRITTPAPNAPAPPPAAAAAATGPSLGSSLAYHVTVRCHPDTGPKHGAVRVVAACMCGAAHGHDVIESVGDDAATPYGLRDARACASQAGCSAAVTAPLDFMDSATLVVPSGMYRARDAPLPPASAAELLLVRLACPGACTAHAVRP